MTARDSGLSTATYQYGDIVRYWYDPHCRTWVVEPTDMQDAEHPQYCYTQREAREVAAALYRTIMCARRQGVV